MRESKRGSRSFILGLFTLVGLTSVGCPGQTDGALYSAQALAFSASPQAIPSAFQIAVDDVDSDGDLDVVLSLRNSSSILLNDGHGYFTDSGFRLPISTHGVAIGDLDLDGDNDIVFAPYRTTDLSPIYLNDGSGRFQSSNAILNKGAGIHLLDLEKDGDLDAVIENSRGDTAWLNLGNMQFQQSGARLPGYSSFADLDGDGWVDMVSPDAAGFRVFRNDRSGHFIEHSMLRRADLNSRFVAFADVENDGDTDIVFSNGGGGRSPSGLFLNDGQGNLTDSGQRLANVELGRIGTGDLNNDGHVDIIFTDRERPAQVWLNNGAGTFFDSGIRLMRDGACHGVVIRDLDNDGDQDVIIANYLDPSGNSGLWFNQIVPSTH